MTVKERIRERSKEIEQCFFGGRKFGNEYTCQSFEADVHKGGERTLRINTDAGSFYYKPRDCGTDLCFQGLINKYFQDITKTPKMISGDGYGFFEEVSYLPVDCQREAEKFFFRLGGMMALFHALGSTDVHGENLMAFASIPVLVDTETILTPVPLEYGRRPDGLFLRPSEELEYSINETLMLPYRSFLLNQLSPLYQISGHALPYLREEKLKVCGYEEFFLSGFREIYLRCMVEKEGILAYLADFEKMPVRHVLRNTMFYDYKRTQLGMATNESGRKAILGTLDKRFLERGAECFLAISQYEKEALLKNDIPYFITCAGSRDLFAEELSQTPLVKDFFELSALENAEKHLGRLSEDEMEFECSLIRAEFAYADAWMAGKDKRTLWQRIVTDGFGCVDARKMQAGNSLILSMNNHAVLFPDGRKGWVIGPDSKPQICTMGAKYGIAGAAGLLMDVLDCENDPIVRKEALELLENCAKQLEQYLNDWDKKACELEKKGCRVLIEKELKNENGIKGVREIWSRINLKYFSK